MAAGIAPLLLAIAPCAAMCALGLCMNKAGAKSCSGESKSGDQGAWAETNPASISAGNEPVAVKALAMALPALAWSTVAWREGTNNELSGRFAGVRVRPAHRDYLGTEMRPVEWLLIEWPEGEAEPTKYFLSTAPEEATLEQMVFVTKMRWRIERDYQDLKQDFGLGHYEGRGWRGFHHHATLSIAAYGFLMAQRLKTGSSDAGGKKNFAQRQVPAVPKDYIPRGRPARAASRTGLDHDAAPAPERRTRKRPGTLPALPLDKPKITFVTQ